MSNLKTSIEELCKRYGKSVIVSGNDLPPVRKIATEVPAFDFVATGGFIVNQCNELYGPFSSLKSYMFMCGVAKFQKYDWANDTPNAITSVTYKNTKSRSKDEALATLTFNEIEKVNVRRGYSPKNAPKALRVVWIDVEGTLNKELAEKVGVDMEGLIYYVPDSMNQAIDVAEVFLRNPEVCLVVIDSMVAIGSDAENEKSMEDLQMGVNAALWNKASRKLRSAMNTNQNATLFTVNGSYSKLGISFGDPEQLKNGEQWKLFKSLSIKMNALKAETDKLDGTNKTTIGKHISMYNKKNKFGQQFRNSEMYFSFVDDGELMSGMTDVTQQLLGLGVYFNLVERTGNSYEYCGVKALGSSKFCEKLNKDKSVYSTLHDEVYKLIN